MPPPTDRLGRKTRKCRKRDSPFTLFDDQEFTARYRLSKDVVRKLVAEYKQYSKFKGSTRGGGLSYVDRFCLILRYFASGSFYAMTGDSQKVSRTAVCRSLKDVAGFFYANRSRFIRWPHSFEAKMEAALKLYRHRVKRNDQEVEQRTPFVFGFVDGTHIAIKTPEENESPFVNRNGYHSINTTVVCDYDKKITYIDPRWPGSVHDAYALSCCPVGDEIESEAWEDFVLLGDAGYGVKRNLFTPFKDETSPKIRSYNTWHRKSRVRVEQAIGILKQRWRVLDSSAGYIRHKPQTGARIIYSCACLHNIAIDHGIRLADDQDDPYRPLQVPLAQPRQRTRQEENDRNKSFRQAYVDKFF